MLLSVQELQLPVDIITFPFADWDIRYATSFSADFIIQSRQCLQYNGGRLNRALQGQYSSSELHEVRKTYFKRKAETLEL